MEEGKGVLKSLGPSELVYETSPFQEGGTLLVTSERLIVFTATEAKYVALEEVSPRFFEGLPNSKTTQAIVEKLVSERRKVTKAFAVSGAGISGIMRKQRLKQKNEESLAEETRKDLDKLKEHAAQVVDMLRRYGDRDEGMRNLGIASAPAKEKKALARAVALFVVGLSEDKVLSVPDVYCKFNRARGVDLVSPDDFVEALEESDVLEEFGLEFKVFSSSGKSRAVKVIRRIDHDTSRRLLDEQAPLTAVQAAALLRVPASLAKQHLLDAEEQLLLCRDDHGGDDTSFYPNYFLKNR